MMRSLGVRDVIMGEFAALGIIGGGAGLGEPYYNGRTADESKPPGWTPDPAAWDPYYNRKTGRSDDPFYNTLRASPRFPSLPEPPPTDPSDYTLQGGLSISFSIPFGDLASATSVPPYPTFEMKTEMGTVIVTVESGELVPPLPPLPPPIVESEELVPTPLPFSPQLVPTANEMGTATMPPILGPRPSRAALTEKMLYRELAQSRYSPDALNRLNKYYEEQFDWSVGNLREVALKRATAFATASGGQWRQGDYLNSIGNGVVALLDVAGVAFLAGDSWKETRGNLAKGVLIGGIVGSLGVGPKTVIPDEGLSLGSEIHLMKWGKSVTIGSALSTIGAQEGFGGHLRTPGG